MNTIVRSMKTIKQSKTGDFIFSLPTILKNMGANGLWDVIEDTAQARSLLNYATLEGFQRNSRKQRALVVGRLQFSPGFTDIFRIFFFKLAQVSRVPATFVWAFDGFGKPQFKRGKRVLAQPQQLIEGLKEVIKAFGHYAHQAPGEAEAELAQMNKLGFIDAVITEDSDAFIFGADCVIRKLGADIEKNIQIFHSRVLKVASVGLDEDGLLLYVLLAGGDYDDGVPGCGAVNAQALARCGFGQRLRQILVSYAGKLRDRELAVWRDQIRAELRTNASNLLKNKQAKLAKQIPDSFPSSRVVDLYTSPYTSWSFKYMGQAPQVEAWVPREPNIHALATFARDRLNWDEDKVKKRFLTVVWPPVAFKMISSPLVMYNAPAKKFITPYTNARLVKIVKSSRSTADDGNPSMERVRLRVSIDNFQRLGGIQVASSRNDANDESILALATRNLLAESTSFHDVVEIDSSDEDSCSDSGTVENEGQGGSQPAAAKNTVPREIIDLTDIRKNLPPYFGEMSRKNREKIAKFPEIFSISSFGEIWPKYDIARNEQDKFREI
ncbi:PIN domain-like protein [Favolaschia claudopus]|uniref:PIN domain-like protein n=1 Tax=Favolaschia claudopus TaxID=2862362 RepID=A0AAW0BLU5_9AGAR